MSDPIPADFSQRLGVVVKRAAADLGPEVGGQLLGLVSPANLGIMGAFLTAWVIGHAFGIGEVIDIVVVAVGIFSVGLAVFSGLDELFEFGRVAYTATSDADIDISARHLAKAIAILGVGAVIAVLSKGAGKSYPRGGRIGVGAEPPRTPGLRYEPQTIRTPNMGAEEGATTFWGDVELSTRAAPRSRR